jgi:hypothetical protein
MVTRSLRMSESRPPIPSDETETMICQLSSANRTGEGREPEACGPAAPSDASPETPGTSLVRHRNFRIFSQIDQLFYLGVRFLFDDMPAEWRSDQNATCQRRADNAEHLIASLFGWRRRELTSRSR